MEEGERREEGGRREGGGRGGREEGQRREGEGREERGNVSHVSRCYGCTTKFCALETISISY